MKYLHKSNIIFLFVSLESYLNIICDKVGEDAVTSGIEYSLRFFNGSFGKIISYAMNIITYKVRNKE